MQEGNESFMNIRQNFFLFILTYDLLIHFFHFIEFKN